jgi:hypothetical protein
MRHLPSPTPAFAGAGFSMGPIRDSRRGMAEPRRPSYKGWLRESPDRQTRVKRAFYTYSLFMHKREIVREKIEVFGGFFEKAVFSAEIVYNDVA